MQSSPPNLLSPASTFFSAAPRSAAVALFVAISWQWLSAEHPDPDGKQLASIYAKSTENYVFYNDQLPNGSNTDNYGHSKGFFAWDSSSAFWVQHSIPKFPNYVRDGYLFGSGQMWYGQHAFCMSLAPSALLESPLDLAPLRRVAAARDVQQGEREHGAW